MYLTSFVTKDAVGWAVFFVDGAPAAAERKNFILFGVVETERVFILREASVRDHSLRLVHPIIRFNYNHRQTQGEKFLFLFLLESGNP